MTERDADPCACAPDLQDRVLPGALGRPTGDKEVAVSDRERARCAASARPKEQIARLTQRDERHDRLDDLLADLVTVPGDAVAAVAVQVEAGRVEQGAVASREGESHRIEDRG